MERYQDRLFDLAMRMTRNRQDSEDLVQTAFVRMFRKLDRYDPRFKFSTWAYTVTLNLVRNHLRKKALIRFLSLDWAAGSDSTSGGPWGGPAGAMGPPRKGVPEARDRGPEADQHLEQERASLELERAVESLPAPLRESFVLHHLHSLPVKEVAAAAGTSENAVKIRLHRARQLLRGRLAEQFPEWRG